MPPDKPRYVHLEKDHNLNEPQHLVPVILNFFDVSTVCDVGCGLGNFLKVFKDNGKKVIGLDGAWVDPTLRRKNIDDDEFREVDFEKGFPTLPSKFDLAICLEVAEHLKAQNADGLIKFLSTLSDNIVFSAAIPFQGGDDHINENWEHYWEEKFIRQGFKKYDLIRHKIWNNQNIQWWYRQNMIIYSKNDLSQFQAVAFDNVVTKECYEQKIEMLSNYSGIVLPKLDIKKFILAILTKMFGKKMYFLITKPSR